MTKVLEPDRKYVCGFMFDESRCCVLLIHKLRPDWQAGKLNGVGGRVEEGETEAEAMRREFKEETGIDHSRWQLFCVLKDARGWPVYFFFALGKITLAKTTTDEIPRYLPVERVQTRDDVIPNLRWLIPMAHSMQFESISHFSIQECATAFCDFNSPD